MNRKLLVLLAILILAMTTWRLFAGPFPIYKHRQVNVPGGVTLSVPKGALFTILDGTDSAPGWVYDFDRGTCVHYDALLMAGNYVEGKIDVAEILNPEAVYLVSGGKLRDTSATGLAFEYVVVRENHSSSQEEPTSDQLTLYVTFAASGADPGYHTFSQCVNFFVDVEDQEEVESMLSFFRAATRTLPDDR